MSLLPFLIRDIFTALRIRNLVACFDTYLFNDDTLCELNLQEDRALLDLSIRFLYLRSDHLNFWRSFAILVPANNPRPMSNSPKQLADLPPLFHGAD